MYRTVETGAWDDPEVRPLSPQAKLLFFYLFTNRHTHVSGIYYLLPVTAAAETGLPLRVVDTLWDTLSSAELAWFDAKCLVVFVRSMLRHQGRGEKNERAAAIQLGTLHNSFLISKFLSVYPSVVRFLDDRVSDRVSKGDLPRAREEQEQEQKKEQEGEALGRPAAPVAARVAKPDQNAGFEEFYRAYPRRVKPGAARKAWREVAARRPPLVDLLAAIERQRPEWTEPRFIPHPATWLRSESWANESLPLGGNGKTSGPRRFDVPRGYQQPPGTFKPREMRPDEYADAEKVRARLKAEQAERRKREGEPPPCPS